MDRLLTPQARTLLEAMHASCEALAQVHTSYEGLLTIINSTSHDAQSAPDTIRALQREGRAYAQALTAHSKAAMAWLAYVDSLGNAGPNLLI